MKETHLTQRVEDIPGRRVILSAGIGQTNVDDLQWLMDTVLKHAAGWKATGNAAAYALGRHGPLGATLRVAAGWGCGRVGKIHFRTAPGQQPDRFVLFRYIMDAAEHDRPEL